MITLGIETSCDETALALIETRESVENHGDPNSSDPKCVSTNIECCVINALVHSQAELHSAYGGVYPNLAKREHGKNIVPLLQKLLEDLPGTGTKLTDEKFASVLQQFKLDLESQNPDLWQSFSGADFLRDVPRIDRIAVTEGPGLEPTLWVGINFARVLGALWNIPIIPVNHMEGHIVGSLLESDKLLGSWQKLKPLQSPAIALLVSGGHTELVRVDCDLLQGSTECPLESEDCLSGAKRSELRRTKSGQLCAPLRYTILGQTLDDAVGEAFDKVARLLGLPYPGGLHISKLSEEAEEMMTPRPVKLPRPVIGSGDLKFSFSGLKTAVLYATRKATQTDGSLTDEFKRGLALEFELAVTETLEHKLRSAIDQIEAKTVIIGGGVSANKRLRERFTKLAREYAIPIYLPSRHISGDNALMIALAGAMDSTAYPDTTGKTLKADGTKRLGNRLT